MKAAFNAHPEWPLQYDDFVLHKVDWEPKGVNVPAAVAELGISELEACVFIDDNPVEVQDVQQMAPGVSTMLFPTEEVEQTFVMTQVDSKKTKIVLVAGMRQRPVDRRCRTTLVRVG